MFRTIATVLAKVASIVDTALKWAKQRSDENTGRQLQQTDNLKASVNLDHAAAQTRQDVAGLSDTALNDELRNGPSTDR